MKKLMQLSIALSIAMLVNTIAFADSDRIYNTANGHWYQRFDNNSMTWHDAKQYCERLDGYLVTITSQEEDDFVYNNLGFDSPHDCWLGGTDESQEDDWRWITGGDWDYTNWEMSDPEEPEPNNCGGGEHYLMYWTPNSWRESARWKAGFWNDTATGENGALCCSQSCGELWPMSTICEWWGWESYDTFENLDFEKWQGGGIDNAWAVATFIREASKNKKELQLAVEVYGPIDGDGNIWSDNGLRMIGHSRGNDLKAIRADVRIKKHEPGCCGGECAGANAEILRSVFRLNAEGTKFATDYPDAEVHAGIAVETQNPSDPDFSADVLVVRVLVYWCHMHNDCSVGEIIGDGPDFIGTVNVKETNTISMELDQTEDQVIFQLNNDQSFDISYADFLIDVGGTDDDSPNGPFIDLRITAGGKTCASDRQSGFMEVTFDNVEVIEY